MSQESYINEKYIIYDKDSLQYTRANNNSIFNIYNEDTLFSMWVQMRTYDYHICNKGWTLKSEFGSPVFSIYKQGKEIKVASTAYINDAQWHLICWGKYKVNNKIRLFITVDVGFIYESEDINSDFDFGNDEFFNIARFGQSTYSTLYADELFILKGIKYYFQIGLSIYNQGIFFPGYPIDLWPKGELRCYWMFNNQNTVLDQSGNENDGIHYFNPKIVSHAIPGF